MPIDPTPGNCAARFLVASVRRFLDPDAPAPNLATIDDVSELRRLAAAHSVVPIVCRALESLDGSSALREALQPDLEEDLSASLLLSAELCKVTDLLNQHEITFVSLKGPLLSQRLYNDIAVRAPGDLDLLLEQRDVLRVRDLLIGAGYRVGSPLPWSDDSACFKSRESEITMADDARALAVDLHWRPVPGYFASAFDRISIRDSIVSTPLSGRMIPDLAPAPLLLFLCAHAAKHGFERLGWICDIATCLRRCEFDWKTILSLTRASASTRQLLVGLGLAAKLLGAPLPSGLPEDQAVNPLVEAVNVRLLSGNSPPITANELIPFCLSIFETQRQRLRYLRGHLSPSAAEYQALRLPPGLHFLYYLFRPLRLAAKAAGIGRA